MDESRDVMEKTADEKFIASSDTVQSRYHSYCYFLGRVKREMAECHTSLEVVYFKCMET